MAWTVARCVSPHFLSMSLCVLLIGTFGIRKVSSDSVLQHLFANLPLHCTSYSETCCQRQLQKKKWAFSRGISLFLLLLVASAASLVALESVLEELC